MSWLSISVFFLIYGCVLSRFSLVWFCLFVSFRFVSFRMRGNFSVGVTTWFQNVLFMRTIIILGSSQILRVSRNLPTFACCGHLKAFYHNRIENTRWVGPGGGGDGVMECSNCGHGLLLPDCFNGFLFLMRVHCAHIYSHICTHI